MRRYKERGVHIERNEGLDGGRQGERNVFRVSAGRFLPSLPRYSTQITKGGTYVEKKKKEEEEEGKIPR